MKKLMCLFATSLSVILITGCATTGKRPLASSETVPSRRVASQTASSAQDLPDWFVNLVETRKFTPTGAVVNFTKSKPVECEVHIDFSKVFVRVTTSNNAYDVILAYDPSVLRQGNPVKKVTVSPNGSDGLRISNYTEYLSDDFSVCYSTGLSFKDNQLAVVSTEVQNCHSSTKPAVVQWQSFSCEVK